MQESKLLLSLALLGSSLYAQPVGALLLEGNCITCHHYTKDISAPSLTRVTQHYKEVYSSKKLFVDALSDFVKKPQEQHSIMLNDVKTYSLMPELAFERSTLQLIAEYLYDNAEDLTPKTLP